MAHVLAIRTEHDSVFRSGFWTNRALIGAVGLTVALQLAVVYLPPLQAVFGARALAPSELALSLGLSAVVFGAVEFEKWLRRRAEARNTDANHA
jgi:Ca2+-transporting ATPase